MFEGKQDVIILEGWLVGAIAPDDFAYSAPINAIERSDEGAVWLRYQKHQMDTRYATLWASFDAYIHIKGPGFDTVFDWRKQQEAGNLGLNEADLPHLGRAITVVILIQTIFILSILAEIFVTTSGAFDTKTLTYLIFQRITDSQNIGLGSAGGVYAIILANIVALFLMRIVGKNLDA